MYPFFISGDFVKIKSFLLDFLFYILGSAAYSAAVIMFLSANEISPGGLTGIATVLNYLFSLPIGTVVFVLNIPLLILGFFKFGKHFILRTAIATVCVSAILDIFEAILPVFEIDLILASVFGGILMGFGISVIMLRGGTTGGVDIIAKLINRIFPYISVGKLILFSDAAVVVLSVIVYKNTQSALYTVVALYASSRVMDLMLYGADKGKIIYIITTKTQDIVSGIFSVVKRGVTIIDVVGGYTGDNKKMIMCTARRNEVHAIYTYARKCDSSAFIVVAEAGEILGEGFKK